MNTAKAINTQEAFSLTMKNCSLLCSILVVFIHSYNVAVYNISANSCVYWLEEIVSQCIARGAVPFFFVSSAFFLYSKEKSVLSVYKSRFKSILLPYLLWNIIYMFFFTVLNKLSLSDGGMDKINVANILEGIFLYKYHYPYWFMFYLIIFTLLYPVIKLIICKNKLVCFLGLASLLVLYLFNVFSRSAIECLIYYYLGAMFGFHYKEKIKKLATTKTQYKLFALAAFVLIETALFVVSNIYEINVSLIKNIIMVLSLFLVSSLLKLKIPQFLLNLSFMIYSIHPIVLEAIEKIVFIVCPHNDLWALIGYIVAPIVSVVIIVGICVLLKKILPSLYMLLNGNRK